MNIRLGLMLLYPLSVHISVLMGQPLLQVIAITVMFTILMFNPLKAGSKAVWAFFLLILAMAVFAAQQDLSIYALYLPPIIIPALLFWFFLSSLLPGRVALVTAIGEQVRGPLSEGMRRYTHYVTVLWVIVFGLMATCSAMLAWLASNEVWSLFTNFLNYLMVGAIFAGEYVVRRMLFRDHNHPSFTQYLRIVTHVDLRK